MVSSLSPFCSFPTLSPTPFWELFFCFISAMEVCMCTYLCVWVYAYVCAHVCVCKYMLCMQGFEINRRCWFLFASPPFWNKIFHWTWNLLSLFNFWPPSSRVSLAFASSALGVQAVCYLPHMFYMGSGFSGSPACVAAWDWWSYLHRSQW